MEYCLSTVLEAAFTVVSSCLNVEIQVSRMTNKSELKVIAARLHDV